MPIQMRYFIEHHLKGLVHSCSRLCFNCGFLRDDKGEGFYVEIEFLFHGANEIQLVIEQFWSNLGFM